MILVDQKSIDEFVAKGWWGTQTLGDIFLDTAARQADTFAVSDPRIALSCSEGSRSAGPGENCASRWVA